jgi:hypothetical protein
MLSLVLELVPGAMQNRCGEVVDAEPMHSLLLQGIVPLKGMALGLALGLGNKG